MPKFAGPKPQPKTSKISVGDTLVESIILLCVRVNGRGNASTIQLLTMYDGNVRNRQDAGSRDSDYKLIWSAFGPATLANWVGEQDQRLAARRRRQQRL